MNHKECKTIFKKNSIEKHTQKHTNLDFILVPIEYKCQICQIHTHVRHTRRHSGVEGVPISTVTELMREQRLNGCEAGSVVVQISESILQSANRGTGNCDEREMKRIFT